MKRRLLIFSVLLLASCSLSAQSGQSALSDKTLVELFSVFKKTDGYTYQIQTESHAVTEPGKIVIELTDVYQSNAPFVTYSSSEREVALLCRKGQFKVDKKNKTIQYKEFVRDAEYEELVTDYNMTLNQGLDSIFLKDAFITSKKTGKTSLSYLLHYGESSYFKSLHLVCRRSDSIPDSLVYIIERPMPGFNNDGNATKIIQKVKTSRYRKQQPNELGRLSQHPNLVDFLQNEYKGYKLQNI